MDEFAVGIWQLDVFIDLVWNPLDFELFESPLARCGEFLASLAKDAVGAFDSVHPDAVVVIAERQEVGSIGFEEGHAGMEVLADAVCFLLLRRTSAEAGEVEHVAKVDLVVRFPVIAEVEELLDRDRTAKLSMIVGADDKFLKAHNGFSLLIFFSSRLIAG